MLASSSAGNSTFIATETTRVLIDAGLSRKEIFQRLAAIGEDAKQLDGILVTHEHSDHVCGLPVMLKHISAPVFATPLTASTIDWGGAAAFSIVSSPVTRSLSATLTSTRLQFRTTRSIPIGLLRPHTGLEDWYCHRPWLHPRRNAVPTCAAWTSC